MGVNAQVAVGVDVGSVSTNVVALEASSREVLAACYVRTQGRPIQAVQQGLSEVAAALRGFDGPGGPGEPGLPEVVACGATGSGRKLAGVICGADVVKNEITAHAVASCAELPAVRTVIEIGGQDSKIIIIRDGVVVDFAMNTVCAAGTGSFLDQQAFRLNVPIQQFGSLALRARNPVRIAGRCAVFAESDMVHKQQMGHSIEDIVGGLCEALVRNYLNNVGKDKDIQPPSMFQGGVAANEGMRRALEKALGQELVVPRHHAEMGAIGAALLALEQVSVRGSLTGSRGRAPARTSFTGFDIGRLAFAASSFECKGCPNRCEVVNIHQADNVVARWGDRCGKWSSAESAVPVS